MNISVKKVEANRNFANKVWNIGRFVISAVDRAGQKTPEEPVWTLPDQWIWARLKQVVNSVNTLFENYQFGEAGKQIYEFFWSEFADWYLEASKRQLAGRCRAYFTAFGLARVLDVIFAPLASVHTFRNRSAVGVPKTGLFRPGLPVNSRQGWKRLILARWPGAWKWKAGKKRLSPISRLSGPDQGYSEFALRIQA